MGARCNCGLDVADKSAPIFLASTTERNFVAHNVATVEVCGCDEAKAWRERALKAEAELQEAIGAIEAAVLGDG